MRPGRTLLWAVAWAAAGLGAAGDDAIFRADDHAARDTAPRMAAAPAQPSVATDAPLLDLEQLRQAREAQSPVALFAAKSWYVAPPPPPPAPPPPRVVAKPVPPPLPFVFMGRMIERGRPTVFLVNGDRVHMAVEGDVIDENYRLEKIGADQLTLLYLPLHTAQTLAAEDPT